MNRWCYYEIFERIRTPETVRRLEQFLSDERDPWKDMNFQDGVRPSSNAIYSMMALRDLGLKDPPVRNQFLRAEDLHTWQLWFQQVQAGTRTFSFEGDDRVYTLNGPVSGDRAILAPSNSRTSKPKALAEPTQPSTLKWWLTGLTIFVVGSGVWVVKHRRHVS